MWLSWAGCAWIPLEEHEKNQQALDQLLESDADADADADSDADTDSDTDADTDLPGCLDDDFEENDSRLTATVVDLPRQVDATLCPDDEPLGGGTPTDLWKVEVPELSVLLAALLPRGETPCEEQTLVMAVTDNDGAPFPDAVTEEACDTLHVGWGPGTYYVQITDLGGSEPVGQDYSLDLSLLACTDDDGDGYLSEVCGGPDCSDTEDFRYPGAYDAPLDGQDEDCDGGDEYADACTVTLAGAVLVEDTLPCEDLEDGAAWDHWHVPVGENDEVSVVVQNSGDGLADPVAFIVDPDGTTHYGLDPTGEQMNDDISCDQSPWTGQSPGCPGACVNPTADGMMHIWVAQKPGAGCATADYQVLVFINGAASLPVILGDNVPLVFP
jgi:hypothetical protein